MHQLVIVGGGRMGEALLGGLLAAGRAPGDLAVVEPVAGRQRALGERFPGVIVNDGPLEAEGVVLAVKPGLAAAAAGAACRVG